MTAARRAGAGGAGAEQRAQRALADAVGDAAGSISVALLAQAVAGESVTQRSSSLSLRVWRADAATDLTTLELDEEDGDGRRLSGELDAPGMARLPPGLIAEAGGGGEVDVQMVQYGLNPRGYAAPPPSPSSGLASNLTTLTLRNGTSAIAVSGLAEPIEFSLRVSLPATDEDGARLESCDMALFEQCEREKNETADAEVAKEVECNRKALEDDVWSWLMPSTGAAKDVCADELSEANVSKLNTSSTCDGLRCRRAALLVLGRRGRQLRGADAFLVSYTPPKGRAPTAASASPCARAIT